MKIMLLVSLLILTISGCDDKKNNDKKDISAPVSVSDVLKGLVNNSKVDINLKQHAQLAMSKCEDGVMEPEPILIDAIMKTVGVEEGEIMSLRLIIYDEDADFIGFVVEEEHLDSNGVITAQIVEKYPVFTYLPYASSSELLWQFIPVWVRDENQRKPEEQWLKYINTPLQQQKDEYKKRTNKNWTWLKTLPPVWLSIPEPDKLNVYVQVYDRAGHLSERIRVVYSQKKWPSEK
jgi:hypothetical protein